MIVHADAIEWAQLASLELGQFGEPTRFIAFLPDKKHFVGRVERVDLEFIITVAACDEELDVVVLVDVGVAIGEARVDERFFDAIGHVKILVVPCHAGARVVDRRTTGEDVVKARRPSGIRPRRLVEMTVNRDRSAGAIGGVAGDFFIRAGKSKRSTF